ncbi:MAG: glycosyltransferase family 4 protein [Pseudomonadota bacterium]
MKILLITGFFPPYAPVAATRVAKLAKFFHNQGHDVRVIGAMNPRFPPVMQPEIPAENIIYAEVKDRVAAIAARASSKKSAPISPSGGAEATPETAEQPSKFKAFAKWVLTELLHNPDHFRGWVKPAIKAGEALLETWRADLIYVSAPPHSSVLVGGALAKTFDIPWVPEFRDAWTPNPYYDNTPVRRFFERQMEDMLLRSTAGIVALTETWTAFYAERYGKPTELVMNGFDPDDFPIDGPPVPFDPISQEKLTILYAGSIYLGKRDPTTLFAAMQKMGSVADRIEVHFYVEWPGNLKALAEKFGVEANVKIHAPVPYQEIVRLQQSADILLLLRWDHPGEDGVLAGKLFEYIAARRPVLSLGSTTGEAAKIINDNALGLVTRDVDETVAELTKWLAAKPAGGLVPGPENVDVADFARSKQFEKLDRFLRALAEKRAS